MMTIFVMSGEMFNTAIERMCDLIQPERDERVRIIKDIAAAACRAVMDAIANTQPLMHLLLTMKGRELVAGLTGGSLMMNTGGMT